MTNSKTNHTCDVCGSTANQTVKKPSYISCIFCGFTKNVKEKADQNNNHILFAADINAFFKRKYIELQKGDTFNLEVPVSRFYKTPTPKPNQINFFNSKNIMFLLEQHGFQMVSRRSRFSTRLRIIVRKV